MRAKTELLKQNSRVAARSERFWKRLAVELDSSSPRMEAQCSITQGLGPAPRLIVYGLATPTEGPWDGTGQWTSSDASPCKRIDVFMLGKGEPMEEMPG